MFLELLLQLLSSGASLIVVIPVILAIGVVVGIINSLIVIKGGVPSFIATLGMMTSLRGVTYLLCNGQIIGGLSKEFTTFSGTSVWIIPSFVVIFLIVLIIGHFVLSRTNLRKIFIRYREQQRGCIPFRN